MKTAERSVSARTPSPVSICEQNEWVVAIVAASNPASATASRSQRAAT